MTTTYIITGPPGAGKSTVSDILASQCKLGIHIHADDIYNMVKGGYKLPWDDTDNFLMNTMFDAAISINEIYAQKGFESVIDYVFHLDQLIEFIKKLKGRVSLTVLLPQLSENLTRDQEREWTLGEERIKHYHQYFKNLSTQLSQFMIDNTDLTAKETNNTILGRTTYSIPEILELLS